MKAPSDKLFMQLTSTAWTLAIWGPFIISWSNYDIVAATSQGFGVPIGFDTDVNGAALGEWQWGAAQGLDTFIYLTIGTGIGGGGLINGKKVAEYLIIPRNAGDWRRPAAFGP